MTDARIEISNLCNYTCSFCPWLTQTRKKEYMKFENFKIILDKIKGRYEHITFSGMGEPMIHPEFMSFVAAAKIKGFKVLIITNGSKLTKETFLLLQQMKVETIRISWYEMEEQRKVLNEILPLRTTTKINLHFTPEDPGKLSTVKFIDDFKDRADIIEVWTPHNWASKDKFNYRKVQENKSSCGRIKENPIQIQVDGTVVMCCLSWDNQLPLGNILTQSIEDIYQSEMYKRLKRNEFEGLICENCEFRNLHKEEVLYYSNSHIIDRIHKTSTTFEQL